MNAFSAESRFVLKNWDRVAELTKAIDDCRSEMKAYFHSLENILKKKPWWDTGLKFFPNDEDQC